MTTKLQVPNKCKLTYLVLQIIQKGKYTRRSMSHEMAKRTKQMLGIKVEPVYLNILATSKRTPDAS